MAMVQLTSVLPVGILSLNPGLNTPIGIGSPHTLTASTHKIGTTFQVPKTGTLHSFECLLGTVVQAPANGLKFSFQDVLSGAPDNTIDQFRDITTGITSDTWLSPLGPITDNGTDGGVKRNVTKGDLLACVIEFISFLTSDSLGFATTNIGGGNSQLFTRKSTASGTTYSTSAVQDPLKFVLRYIDGYEVICDSLLPVSATNNLSITNSSIPDELGLRFKIPFNCEINGINIANTFGGGANFILTVYDASDVVLATLTLNGAQFGTTFNITAATIRLAAAVPIIANTLYRITLKNNVSNGISIYEMLVPTNAHLNAVNGGIEIYKTSRVSAGAWTDEATTRILMQILISAIDNTPSSGGGGGESSFVFG